MNQAVKTQTVFNGKEGWLKVNDKDIPIKDELLDEYLPTVATDNKFRDEAEATRRKLVESK